MDGTEVLIKKGQNPLKEEFSGFANPDLNNYLKSRNINSIFIVGLAYDFCVGYTALDSIKNGFITYVIKDACRGISEETIVEIEKHFDAHNVKIINSLDLIDIIS